MSIVRNVEVIIHEVGRWNPSDIAYIRRVSFENWDGTSFNLALHVLIQPRPPLSAVWPDLKGVFWEANILFHDVRDLVLTVCGPGDIQTPGFGLDDISNRQWEGQNLLVYDFEGLTQDGVRFGAKYAEVRSCQITKIPPNSPVIWQQHLGEFPDSSRDH